MSNSLAVILALFGQNPVRVNAHKRAMRQWVSQCCNATIFFEEIVFPGEHENIYKDEIELLSKKFTVRRHVIYAHDDNRDIFQKEVLLNIGAQHASQENIQSLLFLDADIWCRDISWWNIIREKTLQHPNSLVQVFRCFTDTQELIRGTWSLGSETLQKNTQRAKDTEYRHPGFGWAMPTSYWKAIGGWNEYFIAGSGDVCLIREHLHDYYNKYYTSSVWDSRKWDKTVIRLKQPPAILGCAPMSVVHENHGKFQERSYVTSRNVIDFVDDSVQDLVVKDEQGLFKWINPQNRLRYVLRNKALMNNTSEGMLQVCKQQGLVCISNEIYGFSSFKPIYKDWVNRAPENSVFVELGVFVGSSIVYLAQRIQNSGKKISIHGFDIFPKFKPSSKHYKHLKFEGDSYKNVVENISKNGVGHLITIHKMDIHESYKLFEDTSVWAVWLDASHQEDCTYRSLCEWWPKVQKGGYLGGHDYGNSDYPGVKVAVDRFVSENNLQVNTQYFPKMLSFVISKDGAPCLSPIK